MAIFVRYCDRTHQAAQRQGVVLARRVSAALPELFRLDTVFCAGYELPGFGSCTGDSGSPVVAYETDYDPPRYVQVCKCVMARKQAS